MRPSENPRAAEYYRTLGGVVRRDGRFVQAEAMVPTETAASDCLAHEQTYGCEHGQLKKERRCAGCGLTRNEIALEDV